MNILSFIYFMLIMCYKNVSYLVLIEIFVYLDSAILYDTLLLKLKPLKSISVVDDEAKTAISDTVILKF